MNSLTADEIFFIILFILVFSVICVIFISLLARKREINDLKEKNKK